MLDSAVEGEHVFMIGDKPTERHSDYHSAGE